MHQPWKNKLAVLSGASSGLGLHLALRLAEQKARLVLVGRDPVKLEKCRVSVLSVGAVEAIALPFDVTDNNEWDDANGHAARLRSIVESQGTDLLINVVGRSDRGMLESMNTADLLEQFQVNVLSSFRMTQACLPGLKRSEGTIVDIASLAGILAGPGMGGYSLSKHALVGMHRQWRLELANSKVHFMLVCPGPIARDDNEDRYDALVKERNLAAKTARPGGGVRLNRLDPTQLSRSILDAAMEKKVELIIPAKARWLAALLALCPRWGNRILRDRFK